MEADPNPMPEFRLLNPVATIKKIAHFLFDHIHTEGLSDHFPNRGGGPMLDRKLLDQEQRQIDFEDQSNVGW